MIQVPEHRFAKLEEALKVVREAKDNNELLYGLSEVHLQSVLLVDDVWNKQ